MGRVIKLLLYFFGYQLAFSGTIMSYYFIKRGIFNPADVSEIISDPLYINLVMIAQLLSTLAITLHILGWKYANFRTQLNKPVDWKNIIPLSVALIVGMGLWTNYLNELADLPNNMKETFDLMMKNPLGIISIVIMAPLMEELLFRGAIQGHLLKIWKNPVWPIVVSSLLFGIVHGNPAQIPFAFVLGLALGWMYYLTGSIIPSILMHFINNGTAVLLFAFSDNPDATMVSELGNAGAIALAAAGVIITIVSILFIKKTETEKTVWYEEKKEESDF